MSQINYVLMTLDEAKSYFIEPIWDLFLEYKVDSKATFSNPVDTGDEIMEQ